MNRIFTYILALLLSITFFSACNSDNDPAPRNETDILGVWTDGADRYLYFFSETDVYDLRLINEEGVKSYSLMQDSYFYEPGYNFVIFMDFMKGLEGDNADSSNWEDLVSPDVFEVVSLSKEKLTWCWVDNLTDERYKGLSKKEIIGKLIQEADKGFTLLPQNYQTFSAVSEEDFRNILTEYNVWELLDEEYEEE